MSPLTPKNRAGLRASAGEVSGVIDSEGGRAEWVFPAAPDAVRTARSLVRRTLHGWELDSVGDIAALLVSELVTNALRHATGPIGVRLVHRPAGPVGVLLVEVSDPLPDPPRRRVARPGDENGRGLQLVASSARRWGTRPGEVGKTVWFELAVTG
ncbi:ATP-binding protein [Streptomyces ziwulingensis]